MRAIVTGAGGFVGANLVRHLSECGYDVHSFSRKGSGDWRLSALSGVAKLHAVDLSDAKHVTEVVRQIKPDRIFHLAAYGAYSWQREDDRFHAINVDATMNLLNACREHGFDAFINAGTSSEYGNKDHAPDEYEEANPDTGYAITKYKATSELARIGRAENLPIITLRLYSTYGPYEEPRRLVPNLIVKGLNGTLPPLVNPEVAHDFISVRDVCAAFSIAADQAPLHCGAIYNLGTGVQVKMRDVVHIARSLMNIPVEPNWGSMEDREFDSAVWVANIDRIEKELGWSPRDSFEQGLDWTIDWFRQTGRSIREYASILPNSCH